jgi:hypothetical protein
MISFRCMGIPPSSIENSVVFLNYNTEPFPKQPNSVELGAKQIKEVRHTN